MTRDTVTVYVTVAVSWVFVIACGFIGGAW